MELCNNSNLIFIYSLVQFDLKLVNSHHWSVEYTLEKYAKEPNGIEEQTDIGCCSADPFLLLLIFLVDYYPQMAALFLTLRLPHTHTSLGVSSTRNLKNCVIYRAFFPGHISGPVVDRESLWVYTPRNTQAGDTILFQIDSIIH